MEGQRFLTRFSELAREQGFALAGGVDIESTLPLLQGHVSAYDAWLAQGRQGDMAYLTRGRDRRADPRHVFPGARAVLSVALPYSAKPVGLAADRGVRYARYLRGEDYHQRIPRLLERVIKQLIAETPQSSPFKYKICVDTSAVLERSWAWAAGLGWIGKNSMLIHPKWGSYLLLGAVLVDRDVGAGPRPLPDYCGGCNRCMRGCPTGAISAPRELDSRECVSYWTLEKRGELALDERRKKAVGTWVAGCDVCQEVCPFNQKREKSDPAPSEVEEALLPASWGTLLDETEAAYKARVAESSLNRVKPADFARNLKIAADNAGLSAGLNAPKS